jgi:hypothetical protein
MNAANVQTSLAPVLREQVPQSTPTGKQRPHQEDMLIATSMQIMGHQVFLHKATGKLLLEIGSSASPEFLLTGLGSTTSR